MCPPIREGWEVEPEDGQRYEPLTPVKTTVQMIEPDSRNFGGAGCQSILK